MIQLNVLSAAKSFVFMKNKRVMLAMGEENIQKLLDMVADGSGYGDPEARLNDDRKFTFLLALEQLKIGRRLNWLTFFLCIIGLPGVINLALQICSK